MPRKNPTGIFDSKSTFQSRFAEVTNLRKGSNSKGKAENFEQRSIGKQPEPAPQSREHLAPHCSDTTLNGFSRANMRNQLSLSPHPPGSIRRRVPNHDHEQKEKD